MDMQIIKAALEGAEQSCRFHGTDFTKLGTDAHGVPRCESCRQPWRVTRALHQVTTAG